MRRLFLFALLLIAAGWLLLVPLPRVLAPSTAGATPGDTLKAIADTRTSLVQLLGGSALLAGLIHAFQSYWLARKGNLTDRFSEAVRQLGHETAAVRSGGVYALEQVADEDPPTYARTVTDVLVAFVRDRTATRPSRRSVTPLSLTAPARTPRSGVTPADSTHFRIAVDESVQAALTVLSRRSGTAARGHIALVGLSLAGVSLQHARFDGADLNRTDLRNAVILDAELRGATLTGARLDGANLAAAQLARANLEGCSLRRATLYNAQLCEAGLRHADLQHANLSASNLRGADLTASDLRQASLLDANLTGANLRDARMRGTKVRRGDLAKACYVTEAQLREAAFVED